ncbi:MAG: hypothetical protein HQK84_04570, partial [Nitrospinae bacterium]|nr:hypothetical protein [Nitrospinota bacterium]
DGVIDPSLREELEELEETLNGIANDLIECGSTLPENKTGDFNERFNEVSQRMDLAHLKESSSLAHATTNYLQRMHACGQALQKSEIDLILHSIDILEDAIEYVTEKSSEDGLLDSIVGKNMMKLLKRF